MECYYGQVGLNQAYLQSHISYLQSSHAKCISVRPEMYLDGSVLAFYRELFINFSTTSMFLVYPILPHFLGHNFLSLNPSISDKKNIQTLGGDSVVTPLCRAPAPVVPLSSTAFEKTASLPALTNCSAPRPTCRARRSFPHVVVE